MKYIDFISIFIAAAVLVAYFMIFNNIKNDKVCSQRTPIEVPICK